jgi:hypothetical protein
MKISYSLFFLDFFFSTFRKPIRFSSFPAHIAQTRKKWLCEFPKRKMKNKISRGKLRIVLGKKTILRESSKCEIMEIIGVILNFIFSEF